MKQLFSKFLVAFLLTSAVVLSWSEYFFFVIWVYVLYIRCQLDQQCYQLVCTVDKLFFNFQFFKDEQKKKTDK